MKKAFLGYTLIVLSLVGCESKAGTGALIGAGVGTGVGALISPTPAGALIGAGVGAAAGGLIGASLDNEDRHALDNSSPQTLQKVDRGEQLSIEDVKKMSEAGISEEKIIATIHSTGSIYHLSTSDVEELKNAGVSQRIIDYMLKTAYQ